MGQTQDEFTQSLAEWLCWAVAGRINTRVSRHLYCKQQVAGVYRMDEGTLMKRGSPFLDRTKITVDQPARLFDDDDDRRLPENCCLIACKQQ